MDRATYCDPEIWHGFYFELGLEYRFLAEDQRVLRAAQKLWQHRAVTGPWPSREEFGNSIQSIPQMLPRGSILSLNGLLKLPDGRKAACCSFLLRPNEGSDSLSHISSATLRDSPVTKSGGRPPNR